MPNNYFVELQTDDAGNLLLNADPDVGVIEIIVAGPQGPAGSGTGGGTGGIADGVTIDGGGPTTTTYDGTLDGGTP